VPQLADTTRELCIRLALLPDFTEQNWPVLRPLLMDRIEPHELDDLYHGKLLEQVDPPSFGHRSRTDYMQSWLLQERKSETSAQVTRLALDLAAKIQTVDITIAPFVLALASLSVPLSKLEADIVSEGLIQASASLLGTRTRNLRVCTAKQARGRCRANIHGTV
jgi:hypothetical protein